MVTLAACLRGLWRLPLLAAILSTTSFASELRLYVMPTYPVKMNWNSPRELLVSTLKAVPANRYHTIGHISVEVNCTGGPAEQAAAQPANPNYVLTGAVAVQGTFTGNLLLLQKIGFSLVEVGWPGRVETAKEVLHALKGRNRNPLRLAMITYQINEQSCQRLLRYTREYSAQAGKIYYGNSPRPRYKEGSGCSAFGASFLELAGLMTDKLRTEWITRRRVPLSLMAGYQGRPKVSIWDVFRSPDSREWARESDPHMDLETYDPDRMHIWVRDLVASPHELYAQGGEVDTQLPHNLRGIPAIRFDMRHVPTPTEPIFRGEPRLVKVGKKTVTRSDKQQTENGSFEIKP